MSLKKIARDISQSSKYNEKECFDILKRFFSSMENHFVINEDRIVIPKFGSFYSLEQQARKYRNINNQEIMMTKPKKIVRFKCSTFLTDKLNR